MEKVYKFALMGITLAALSGCLYRDVRVPGPLDHVTNFQLTTDDFQILGNVEAEGTIHTVLFLVSWGGAGYSSLYEKAKAMGGDEIIGYVFEIEHYSLVTIVYNRARWKARATVIKYRDKAKAPVVR